MPFKELPGFVEEPTAGHTGALALEFLILTASRTGEVLGVPLAEIDLDARLWTVPPARMKAHREHRGLCLIGHLLFYGKPANAMLANTFSPAKFKARLKAAAIQ